MAPPRNPAAPSKSKKNKKNKKTAKSAVPGTQAMGSRAQGPQQLTTQQFATYAPLTTFTVEKGSTPGGIRVRGRELLQALNSGSSAAGAFGANNTTSAGNVLLNPVSFPRLTAYSTIYEFYKFHSATLMFQSTRPTTAAGVSMIAVDYDQKDAAPTSTVNMMRNISSSMSNIYANNGCKVLGTLSRLPKYVCVEPASLDVDQVYQASIFYAFEGLASTEVNTAQGYLVCDYDVEFFTPS